MNLPFRNEAEWVTSGLFSARIEHATLLRLLLKKHIIDPEEYLHELEEIASDEYMYSIQHFVAQSERQLRDGRWHVGGIAATDQLGRRLALGADDQVLDVGCGIGGPARQLAETFYAAVIGVDIRFDRIVEATLRTMALGLTSLVSFHVAEGERLPFESESFDAVISQATWNWIPDKEGVVREAFRSLKPGGRLGFECEALTEKAGGDDQVPGLFRILAWQQLLGAAGFEDVAFEEMWEASRQFYPEGLEREQIERGERVNVRFLARKPFVEDTDSGSERES